MTDQALAYPLQWPMSRPRTAQADKKYGRFGKKDNSHGWSQTKDITIADAMSRLQAELDRLGARDAVLSSNLRRNMDGSPKSAQSQPDDSGVAVYFTLNGKQICMPCDTYFRVEHNIAGIAAHIEATRAIERYGVATTSEMFRGFEALPAPNSKRPWREVMAPADTLRTKAEVEARYRTLARMRHPDHGGSDAMMAELNGARDDALREIA